MDDVEYILRIVLKARDDMANVLRKAREQIRGFAKDSDTMNASVTNLNQAMKNFNNNMDGMTKKLDDWRAALRNAGGESKEVARSISSIGKESEKTAASTKKATTATGELVKEFDDIIKKSQEAVKQDGEFAIAIERVGKSFNKVTKDFQKGKIDRQNYVADLQRIGKEFQKLSDQAVIGSKVSRALRDAGVEAKRLAGDIAEADKAQAAHTANLRKAAQAQEDLVKSANKQRDAYRAALEMEQKTDKQRAVAAAKLKQIGTELDSISRKIEDASTSKLYAGWAYDAQKNSKTIIGASQDIARESERLGKQLEADAKRQKARQEEIVRLAERTAEVLPRVQGGGRADEDIAELRALQAGYKRLASATGNTTEETRRFGAEAERLNTTLRSTRQETDRGVTAFSKLRETLRGGGDSVAGFDNQVRGMGLLLAVASAQQLISAVIALGGELVSLAGSAAMAGGALGGILAAGAAQALPVLGLLAGAASRVKGVMEAFEATQNVQKAQFTDAAKAGQTQIDKTNALANAQDAAQAATENLTEAREDLNQANKDGVQQLEDLIYAEKAAALAAKGASLNVQEAQKALSDAIREGASGLEIQQRQQAVDEAILSKERAGTTAKRATGERKAAGGDVGNLEGVKNAAKQVEDAERAASRAERTLEQAQNRIEKTASTTATAAANLAYLLSQMTPAERKLLTAFQGLYDNYKKIFVGTSDQDGIYGVITTSFAKAVDRVNQLIQMPKVISAFEGLSGEIAEQIDKIVGSFTDAGTIDQFIGIINNAKENLGPVVDIVIDLGHAFLNIAETANPAFQKLLEYLGPVVDKFLAMTEDSGKMTDFFNEGEEHLESWLDLVGAIIGLFAELVGASAESGKTSIDDLTEKIKGWTDWLADHREEVTAFFEDARDAAYAIGGVLENLAVTLFKTFSAERVENFAHILNDAVIPAVADVITAFGWLVDKVAEFIDTPAGAEIVKLVLVFALFSKVAFGVIGMFDKLYVAFERVGKFATLLKLDVLARHLGKITGATKILTGALQILRTVAMTAFGPWGLVIAAVIIGIVFLLKHFDKLDDVWQGLKDAFKIFMDAIEPALKTLQDALDDVGIHVGSFKDVLKILEKVGKALAEYITVYLVGAFKGLAKIVAGVAIVVIRLVTGIIKIIKGIVDVIVGVFTGDWDQVMRGLEGMVGGVLNIFYGIVEGIYNIFKGLVDLFLTPFKAAWAAVKDFFGVSSPSTLAMELGKAIIDGLVAGAKAAWRAVKNLAGWIWDKIEDGFRGLGRAIRKAAGWIWDKFVDGVKAEIRGFKRIAEWVWDKIKDGFYGLGSAIRKTVSWIWDKFKDFIRAEIRGFKNIGTWIWNAISDSIHAIGSKLENIGSRVINAIVKGIKAAPNAIRDAIKWLLDKVPGGGAIQSVLDKAIPGADKFAEGGPVPGSGSGDTVPAWLTPGEHVLTKGEVEAAGGHAAIFAIRRMLGGGGQGGPYGYQPGGTVIDPRTGVAHGGGGGGTPYVDPSKQREEIKRSNDQRAQDWRVMWNDMLTTARRAANDIEKQFRDMRANTSKSAEAMYHAVRGSLADIEHSFEVRGDRIVKGWAEDWHDLMKVAYDGLFYIGHETNRALTAMGEKHIDFKLTAPKAPDGKAVGGWVGNQGERGQDAGFYALGRGEAVLNYAHQPYVETALNAQYGFGLGGLFSRVRGYHAGGPGQRGFAQGGFAAIPGMPGEEAAVSVIDLIVRLIKRYNAVVTDAYDRDRSAGHASPGHNITGTAVDMVPKIQDAAGWNLIEAMGKWAVSKGMTVGYGAGVPGSESWAHHGRGHHIHIELASGEKDPHVSGVAATVEAIKRRIVTPRGTATAQFVQATIDRVLAVANEKISASSTGPDAGGAVTASGASAAEKVFNFFTGHGLSEAIAAGFAGTFQKESNFVTTVTNARGSGATGLAQWLGDRLTKLKQKKNWTSLQTQLDYVWEELHSTESAAFSAIKGAKSAGEAARIIDGRYERSDAILSAPAYAEAWYKKFAKSKAMGGPIDGPDGTPVPILAHAGEWVLNKGQQLRAAMLAGLSVPGLKAMLGFWGGGGSYAGGGDPVDKDFLDPTKQQSRVKIPVAPIQSLKTLMADVADTYKGIEEMARIMKQVKRKKDKGDAKKVGAAYQGVIDMVDNLLGEGGIGGIAAEVTERVGRAATRLKKDTFQLRDGVAKRFLTAGQVATRELASMVRYTHDLVKEKGVIGGALDKVNAKLKDVRNDKSLKPEARQKLVNQLTAQRNTLVLEQDRIEAEIRDSIEARFQKQIEIQQEAVNEINKRAEKVRGGLDLAKRMAAAVGDEGLVGVINQQIANSMSQTANELEGRIAAARAAGADDLADQLEKDVADLRVQIFEAAQQALKDAADAVSKTAGRERTRLDLFSRMADATGVVGQAAAAAIPGLGGMSRTEIAQGRIAADRAEQAGLIGVRDRAAAAGNVGLVQELNDKINELTVTIAENTKAAFDARIAAVNTNRDYLTSMIDLELQINDLDGTISGSVNLERKAQLLAQKRDELTAKGNELTALLNEATPGTQTYLDLQKAIKENEIATKSNTVALNEVTGMGQTPASYSSTAWAWFRSAFLTGTGAVMQQYVPPTDLTSGTFDASSSASTSSTVNGGKTIITNIEVNEAGQPIDVVKIASSVVHAQATAQ